MTRPDIVYLDTPIQLFGKTVRYSEEGCHYLIQHWAWIVAHTDDKRTDKAHIKMLIEDWTKYIKLYERSRETKPLPAYAFAKPEGDSHQAQEPEVPQPIHPLPNA